MSTHRWIIAVTGFAACATPAAPPKGPEVAVVLAPFRPDDVDSDELFRFEPGHDIETFDAIQTRVHFTRTGPDAVRPADTDADGVPDAVQLVATTYDEVLTFFEGLGFRAPLSDEGDPQGDGGDARLDVYLVDFDGAADGAWVRDRCDNKGKCHGYVAQENDFVGYGYPSYRVATRILASHELFHAVQAAYDANQGSNWSEATAVWASERFDPSLSDLEHFADGWLDSPDKSIDSEPIGPVASYSYGLGIFAQFLYERFGDAIHLKTWEALDGGDAKWLPTLVDLLASDFATTFPTEWVTFSEWALRAGRDDSGGPTFGSADELPELARDEVDLPFSDDKLRVYPTSMQVWSTRGGVIDVAIVSTEAGDTDGLVLVTALRDSDTVRTTVQPGLNATLDGTGSDEVIVAIVNTNLEGNSKRPGLCLGAPADVEACVATLVPVVEPQPEVAEETPVEVTEPGPEVEAPTEATAEVVEPNEVEVTEATSPKEDGGCGAGVTSLFGLALLGLRRRRG